MRKIIFRDTFANEEILLPVTPPSFEVSHGINIETVNIHSLGDVALAGYGTLPTFKIECMFPAQDYPFNLPGTELTPYVYVQRFENCCDNHTVLRFIVSDTMVNAPVIIEEISYGEKDGTGDVYATISMRKYRDLSITQESAYTGNSTRSTDSTPISVDTYVIEDGDILSSICRKFYGDSTLYNKLASYNGIANANLIYAGNTIQIPDVSLL